MIYRGLDLLGLSMMPIEMVSKALKPGCSFGFLMGTFGDAIPNAEYLLLHNNPPACRVHLSNGPCARNHNCAQGEILATQFGKIAERAIHIQSLAIRFPKTKFYISPRVEHDEKKGICCEWIVRLKDYAPSCTPVLSCGPKGAFVQGYLKEDHDGNNHFAQGDIISNDGHSIFEAYSNWPNGASVMALAWDYSCNFRAKDEHIFVPPRKRPLSRGPTHDILIKM